jgi:hypothetical protein
MLSDHALAGQPAQSFPPALVAAADFEATQLLAPPTHGTVGRPLARHLSQDSLLEGRAPNCQVRVPRQMVGSLVFLKENIPMPVEGAVEETAERNVARHCPASEIPHATRLA